MSQVVDFNNEGVVRSLLLLQLTQLVHDEPNGLAVLLRLLFLKCLDQPFNVFGGLSILLHCHWVRLISSKGVFVGLVELVELVEENEVAFLLHLQLFLKFAYCCVLLAGCQFFDVLPVPEEE